MQRLRPGAGRGKLSPVTRPIVFLSDFGFRNEWVGICHAVLGRAAPESRVIDLSHGVTPLDVRAGALVLADSARFLAEDAIVFAVVDPSVGADRDVAIETASGRLLVGPDNGLFSFLWRAEGGVARTHEITLESIVIQPVAPSFHARDVLAPAAAFLAAGGSIEALGAAIDPTTLTELLFLSAIVEPGKIECEVLDLNRFGNVLLNVTAKDFEAAGFDGVLEVAIDATSGGAYARRVSTYADVEPGDWGLIIDPRGWLSVIRGNPANAAEGLGGVQPGDPIWLTLPREEARTAA
jgi:S-adenosyl-L-methionine hydrolase (adenosine-forming)